MQMRTGWSTFFATRTGIIVSGGIIGLLAVFLQYMGNPGNMGLCVACFERDIAGALGLHHAPIVQYLRPEILGLGLGAFFIALFLGDFRARGGSSPIIRFLLGIMAAIGALVFLGCPWRAFLRLAGGDANAFAGILGLCVGIYVATLFFRRGFSLGRSKSLPKWSGFIFPFVLLALLGLRLVYPPLAGEARSGFLWYSQSGPGSMYAPLGIALGCALIIGAIAQRSRFCTMGALRDLFLFKQCHLFSGILAFAAAAFLGNVLLGQFHFGFEGQPVAHTDGLWNFGGMVLAGLAFAFAGGCPGRQLFMGGEGDVDAGIFAAGVLVGAAIAHVWGTASSGAGVGPHGPLAVGIGIVLCLLIGLFYSRQRS